MPPKVGLALKTHMIAYIYIRNGTESFASPGGNYSRNYELNMSRKKCIPVYLVPPISRFKVFGRDIMSPRISFLILLMGRLTIAASNSKLSLVQDFLSSLGNEVFDYNIKIILEPEKHEGAQGESR